MDLMPLLYNSPLAEEIFWAFIVEEIGGEIFAYVSWGHETRRTSRELDKEEIYEYQTKIGKHILKFF